MVPEEPEHEPSGRRRNYLLAVYVMRRWLFEDRCPAMAAVLTLHTLLSTVPILAVALMVVGLLDPTAGADLLEKIFRQLVPGTARAQEMAHSTLQLAGTITMSRLGAWGFLVTLAIAFALFSTLERTFNRIWRATRSRKIWVKFTMFYTLATLGPLVILFSLAEPLLSGVSLALGIPLLTSSLALVLLNRYLPYTDVGWEGPVIAGVVTAMLLEIAKLTFGVYAARFAARTYEGLYGSLAVLPILLIWAYLSWMVVLLGAELAFVIQHRRNIALLGYLNRYVLDRTQVLRPSARTAARLLLAICDQYARRNQGMTADALALRFGIGLDLIVEILERLEREGLVLEADRPAEVFVPARPLDQIRLAEVIEIFDRDIVQDPRDDRLGRLFEDFDAYRDQAVSDLDFETLVRESRSRDAG